MEPTEVDLLVDKDEKTFVLTTSYLGDQKCWSTRAFSSMVLAIPRIEAKGHSPRASLETCRDRLREALYLRHQVKP